jgi:hypothetical protein
MTNALVDWVVLTDARCVVSDGHSGDLRKVRLGKRWLNPEREDVVAALERLTVRPAARWFRRSASTRPEVRARSGHQGKDCKTAPCRTVVGFPYASSIPATSEERSAAAFQRPAEQSEKKEGRLV